jgi:NifU-like protein involved in Fe-S cluster formation/bacterioferritin-associated ferredoxin
MPKTKTTKKVTRKKADIVSHDKKENWIYTQNVKDHFFNPRNFLTEDMEGKFKYNAMGMVGSAACGDMMKIWLKIDSKTEKIKDAKWQTFGCASAIASTSMMSVMITEKGGMTLENALKLKPQDIMNRLGGLPDRKIHCSVLGDKALRSAINDYFRRTKQTDRIMVEGKKVIDKVLNITDHDIEEAVLEGADTFEKVQKKTKVGTGDPTCIPEAEQLIRFYKEKYFG